MTVLLPAITESDLKKINLSIQQLGAGRSNAVGSVTLTLSVATTTVTTSNCAVGSTVILQPTNAASATEYGAGNWFVTAANGSFVITHTNSATAGRTFNYAIVG